MVIVLMGVSGSGKSTVGRILAAQLGWRFVEADDYHPPANIEKMSRGVPLNDDDRWPWLESLRKIADDACGQGQDVVLACSALKRDYQDYLEQNHPACIDYVYLHGSEALIRSRLAERRGHFMDPGLLESQFEALEPPKDAIQVDVSPPPEEIAAEIRRRIKA